MECFSGIGGMIKVGCRLTSVCRRDANSEYLRLTSRSFGGLASFGSLEYAISYSCANSIRDVAPTALFPCLYDLYV